METLTSGNSPKEIDVAVQDTLNPSVNDELDPLAQIDVPEHKRNLRDAQEALAAEFQTLIADTERLLQHTKEVAGAQADELRVKINENITRAKGMLKEREVIYRDKGKAALETTEEYVHLHPWQSIGIAAGVGFLLGLISRR